MPAPDRLPARLPDKGITAAPWREPVRHAAQAGRTMPGALLRAALSGLVPGFPRLPDSTEAPAPREPVRHAPA